MHIVDAGLSVCSPKPTEDREGNETYLQNYNRIPGRRHFAPPCGKPAFTAPGLTFAAYRFKADPVRKPSTRSCRASANFLHMSLQSFLDFLNGSHKKAQRALG
jgi:hypothetical protein